MATEFPSRPFWSQMQWSGLPDCVRLRTYFKAWFQVHSLLTTGNAKAVVPLNCGSSKAWKD